MTAPKDTRPAIRWINYMSDREEMESIYLIGPFESVEERNRELWRLESLPLGEPEYHGGQEFMAATMADAGNDDWFDEVVAPGQVAKASTMRGFHNLYAGYPENEDEPDPYAPHPDQMGLFS